MYRITLDPIDPSIARVTRRLHPSLPLYLVAVATRSRGTPISAALAAAAAMDEDMKLRAEAAAARASFFAWLGRLFGFTNPPA
ncbi:MAG: hypothetical protein AAGA06_08065 [Pseudomonadota bacterium]